MELFITAFLALLNVKILFLMALGIIVGLIFGSIPGLTASMAVALILPMTYGMETVTGMSFLIALYVGGISGGLLSAILLNIPGTPASIATCFDGNPMAKQGKAGLALATGIFASFVGGIIGNIILIVFAPPLANLAIKFSPYEYFAVGCFAITVLATLSSGSFIKGLLSGCLGMFASMFGMSPVDGVMRFTFDLDFMAAGFAFLPAMLGAFALSDIFQDFAAGTFRDRTTVKTVDMGEYKINFADMMRQKLNFIRSALLGTFIGILPGIGGTTASIIAYSEAKRASKHPEKFGTGISDGIVASEASNNACVGGAMVTMVTLGIPGDVVTAILLGGLMIHNVQPGPLLMVTNPEIIYGLFAALFLSNILFFVIEYSGVRLFIKVLKLQKYYLYPLIITMCLVGSYVNNNSTFEVFTMLLFGLIGFLIVRFGYSLPCLVIGFVLGGMIETNFQRAMMFDNGDLTPLFTRPFSLVFMVLTVVSVFFAWRRERKLAARARAAEQGPEL